MTVEEERREPQLEFPCVFPLKVIGYNENDFAGYSLAVVQRHVPDLDQNTITQKLSGEGKYLSVSFVFTAASREQVDNLYRELTASDRVKWVL